MGAVISETDRSFLRRAIERAAEALEDGDAPFGSVLVSGDGEVLFEDRNRVVTRDPTWHPELTIAQWAGRNLEPAERAAATVYTSGEHCVMCAAAHARVGLGRIVFASSSGQYAGWLQELDVPPAPVLSLPVAEVAPGLPVDGPDPELAEQVHGLVRRYYAG